jgi:2-oxoadipate dioxygenase/decarboxylase
MKAQQLFDKLWQDYSTQNPSAKGVHDLFLSKGEIVENDHVAFRTFDDARVNIDVLAKAFIEAGYVHKGDYVFEQKHLIAKHYEHATEKNLPRVFISQLISKDFSLINS